MNKYILVAFGLLGLAFYELSGGADFEPGGTSLVVFAEPKPAESSEQAEMGLVARADTSAITVLSDDTQSARTELDTVSEPETTKSDESVAGVSLVKLIPESKPEPEPQSITSTDTEAVVAAVSEPTFDPEPDLRFINGDRVNMRGGPGTDFAVIGKLYRNDMVEVIRDEGNGWLHLRDTITGDEGWIADWLVTASN